MAETIAEAELILHRHNGQVERMSIQVGRPHPEQGVADSWCCEVTLQSPDYSSVMSVPGPDSLLALIGAVAILNVEMKKLRLLYKEAGRLTYLDDDPYLNFPMAQLWQSGETS